MTDIRVPRVPEWVIRELKRKARRRGMSLQQFLLERVALWARDASGKRSGRPKGRVRRQKPRRIFTSGFTDVRR